MKEHDLIKKIIPFFNGCENLLVGPGDDCAVIQQTDGTLMLAAVDQLVSDVHYISGTSPALIAGKLLRRNLSDIAAMGGIPQLALVTLAASKHDNAWFLEFYNALSLEAQKYNTCICGGDISSLPKSVPGEACTLTILGKVEKSKLCLRSNAKPGDLIYVTGCFGNSFTSEHHLNFIPRLEAAEFIAGTFTNTMIDVSDGLLQDLSHILASSKCGAVLDTGFIPCRDGADATAALRDGEDYELLFGVAPEHVTELEETWPFQDLKLTRIGQFNSSPDTITDRQGHNLTELYKKGFDHFQDA